MPAQAAHLSGIRVPVVFQVVVECPFHVDTHSSISFPKSRLSVDGDSHWIGRYAEDESGNVEVIWEAGVQTHYPVFVVESVAIR